MILFPAIDICHGRCVRLLHGDYAAETDYGEPPAMAKQWVREGAEYLHIVDLDAAKDGNDANAACIREIAAAVSVPVQTGGGIRSLADAESRLQAGIQRVILGTACCENPEVVQAAVKEFGAERVACGIDVKDGFVATRGWLQTSGISPIRLGREMFSAGVRYVVYTDISKDGAWAGANISACKEMMDATGLHVIASGGVHAVSDITALRKTGMYGAVLGKALYEKKLTLRDALTAAKE